MNATHLVVLRYALQKTKKQKKENNYTKVCNLHHYIIQMPSTEIHLITIYHKDVKLLLTYCQFLINKSILMVVYFGHHNLHIAQRHLIYLSSSLLATV